MKFGALVRRQRRLREWSQRELGAMVGVQKRWIIEIEKGADPRLSLGLQLARVLDIPLDSVTP